MAKDKFLRGALILTMAGLMVKIIGSVNRILLSRLLGGEGIGLYQIAYPIYLLIIAISAAGVPVAISILVAKKVAKNDYFGAGRIFKISLGLMAVTGALFALGLYFVAGALVDFNIIRDARAYIALISLTPAVFFATILASFRGYFQGYQMMTPPAVSQILEQFVRVVTMLVLAYWLLPKGLEYAAAGAAFGAVPGSIMGLLVLSVFYVKYKKQWQKDNVVSALEEKESVGEIAINLIKLALPVSCANLMIPVATGIDMLLVPQRLEVAGFSVVEATTAFGYLAGMALPLVMMGTIPTTSLAASVVPAISEAHVLDKKEVMKEKSRAALRYCLLITVPAAIGMIALAGPISRLLYGTVKAADSICYLAPSIVFLGLYQVTTGILQGLGMTNTPMLTMVFSAIVKVFFVWELTAIPTYNIVGAALASDINFAVAAILNIVILMKFTGFSFPRVDFSKIFISSVIMGLLAYGSYSILMHFHLNGVLSTLIAILVGCKVYVLGLILLGELQENELRKIPILGNKLSNLKK